MQSIGCKGSFDFQIAVRKVGRGVGLEFIQFLEGKAPLNDLNTLQKICLCLISTEDKYEHAVNRMKGKRNKKTFGEE